MEKEHSFTAAAQDNGRRLDTVLAAFASGRGLDVSRSAFKSRGIKFSVNGREAKPSASVREGDRLSFILPEVLPSRAVAQDVPFEIVYRDRHIAVVNKPAGLTVHPAKGHEDGTLVNGLLFRLRARLSSVGGVERPGIVHRLDRETSGLMVVALTDRAHRVLSDAFRSRNVVKIYHAVVKGRTQPEGRIELPVGRSPKNRKKMAVVRNGKPALTEYRALKFFRDHSYLEIRLWTGRTHQIRVHFSHLGHAVAGDSLYGRKSRGYGVSGIALCAKALRFEHPVSGKKMKFEIDLPPDFRRLLESLAKQGD